MRRWRRGFNQSELLARELSRLSAVPVVPLLHRTRATPPQVGLKAAARLENVKDAFAIDEKLFERHNARKQPILLLDDVFTTGATLRECAKTLRKAGAGEICAITLARHL